MAHKALYRKWRPEIFEDLIGQEPIITTLKNQIRSGQIAHAYLFTGTRGTGKTSTAKVFAKAVNCEAPRESNPCNQCETCIGITEEQIMDVMEIDAASNNGVENIREIRENVKYHPSKGKYKVYIIDEVHMLSQGAFNALLKTLEEPPAHVIFILATTEPRKIPPTILSRCQRYDFKPVTVENITRRLEFILGAMEIEFDQEALRIIAVSAEGALRDALSILEQSVHWEEKRLSTPGVIDTLGIVPEEQLYETVEALRNRELEQVLKILEIGGQAGKDVAHFTKDLIQYLRKLLMAKVGVELEQFSTMPKDFLQRLKDQSQQLSNDWIVQNLERLSELEGKMKWTGQPRILLEVFLVRTCQEPSPGTAGKEKAQPEIATLAKRIQRLEGMLKEGGGEQSGPSGSGSLPERREDPKGPATGPAKEKPVKKEPPKKASKENLFVDRGKIENHWQDILQTLKKEKKAQLEALLKEGEIMGTDDGALILGFEKGFGFHREALDKKEKKTQIADVIHRITGETVDLKLVMKGEGLPEKSGEEAEQKLVEILPKSLIEFRDD